MVSGMSKGPEATCWHVHHSQILDQFCPFPSRFGYPCPQLAISAAGITPAVYPAHALCHRYELTEVKVPATRGLLQGTKALGPDNNLT